MKNLFIALAFLLSAAGLRADEVKPYPLQTCVVSGEKLGDMGDPYVFTKDGQEIKLCCKHCKEQFEKDPEKFLKKLSEAKS